MKLFLNYAKRAIALALAAAFFCGAAVTACTDGASGNGKAALCAKGGSPYGSSMSDDWDISDFI